MCKIFLLSLGMTLALESIFALIWGVKARDFRIIFVMNCLTNPLVVAWHYAHLNMGLCFNTLLPEIVAMAGEIVILRKFSKSISTPLLFGILINLFSYCLGSVILFVLQGG